METVIILPSSSKYSQWGVGGGVFFVFNTSLLEFIHSTPTAGHYPRTSHGIMSKKPETMLHVYNIHPTNWLLLCRAHFQLRADIVNLKVFLRRDGLIAEQNHHYHNCGKKSPPGVDVAEMKELILKKTFKLSNHFKNESTKVIWEKKKKAKFLTPGDLEQKLLSLVFVCVCAPGGTRVQVGVHLEQALKLEAFLPEQQLCSFCAQPLMYFLLRNEGWSVLPTPRSSQPFKTAVQSRQFFLAISSLLSSLHFSFRTSVFFCLHHFLAVLILFQQDLRHPSRVMRISQDKETCFPATTSYISFNYHDVFCRVSCFILCLTWPVENGHAEFGVSPSFIFLSPCSHITAKINLPFLGFFP